MQPDRHLADVPPELAIVLEPGVSTAASRDWARLEAVDLNSLHQSRAWCEAWAETHAEAVTLLRGQRGGETVFLLPLEIRRQNMVRVAQFSATRFSNINTGLFARQAWENGLGLAAGELGRLLSRALEGHADLLSLRNIPFSWRGARHPLADLPASEHLNHSFQLPLKATMAETIKQLNAKGRRKKYRNQLRKIEAAGGFDHFIASTAEERRALLQLFFVQKAARFRAMGLPDVFHPAEVQAFFHRLAQAAPDGADRALELHGLRIHGAFDGAIAAIAGLSRKGDHIICQFGSIDETILPEASPGELLFWLMIERAGATGAALFDFGLGDQAYKRRWCTDETVQSDILLPITAVGRLAAVAQRGADRAKAAIKSNQQIYALVQRMRARADQATVADDD